MATLRQAVPDAVSAPSATAEQEEIVIRDGQKPLVRSDARASLPIGERFEYLLRHVRTNRPSEYVSLIRKAWEFCVRQHDGQMRASGEPYIIHPLEVAE